MKHLWVKLRNQQVFIITLTKYSSFASVAHIFISVSASFSLLLVINVQHNSAHIVKSGRNLVFMPFVSPLPVHGMLLFIPAVIGSK